MTPKQIWKQHYGHIRAEFRKLSWCPEDFEYCPVNGRLISWLNSCFEPEAYVFRGCDESAIDYRQTLFICSTHKPKRFEFRNRKYFLQALTDEILRMRARRVRSQKLGFKLP